MISQESKVAVCTPPRVLILAHNRSESDRVARILHEKSIHEIRCVEEKYAFVSELFQFVPQIIIADQMVPCFNGWEALYIVREAYPDVPFIMVMDSLEEGRIFEKEQTICIPRGNLPLLSKEIDWAVQAVEEVQNDLTQMRVMNCLRENIEGLGKIRNFLDYNHLDDDSTEMVNEIDSSIDFLEKLSNNLKVVLKTRLSSW